MNNAIDWLMEDDNPAIKFRTLIEINKKNPEDYINLYNDIWEQKQIKKLFKNQNENGLLMKDKSNPIDNLEVFAEYGLSKDMLLDKNAEYSINQIRSWRKNDIDVYACYTPSRLRALVMLDYLNDSVRELIDEFAKTQLQDGGFMCNRLLSRKPDRKSCYKATVPGLLLYAECKRKNILPENTNNLVNYFLKRDVFYSSDKTENLFFYKDGSSSKFSKFGVQLIVYALSMLGAGNDSALQKAWDMMKEREGENGRSRLDGTTKQPGVFGKDGHENKWATFYALLAEKYRIV